MSDRFWSVIPLKFDLTVVFCVIHGFVDVDCDSLFNVIDSEISHTRGHNLRLFKDHCNLNCRLNSFFLSILMFGTVCQLMFYIHKPQSRF